MPQTMRQTREDCRHVVVYGASMSIWGRIFAAMYDRMLAATERDGLAAHRAALLAGASGDVLEIGGGTGANVRFYGDGVQSLTLTEQAPDALFLRAPAEDLPFPDDSFDVAVSTLVLCTVDDQPRALRELRRVLKPGGRLLFIEHVRADDQRLARWQDRLERPWGVIGMGCHPNRATLEQIEAGGFEVEELERGKLPKSPPLVRPMISGRALRVSEADVGE